MVKVFDMSGGPVREALIQLKKASWSLAQKGVHQEAVDPGVQSHDLLRLAAPHERLYAGWSNLRSQARVRLGPGLRKHPASEVGPRPPTNPEAGVKVVLKRRSSRRQMSIIRKG